MRKKTTTDLMRKRRIRRPNPRRTALWSSVVEESQEGYWSVDDDDDDEEEEESEGDAESQDYEEEEEDSSDLESVQLNFRPLHELDDQFYINQRVRRCRPRDHKKEYMEMVKESLSGFENERFRRRVQEFLIKVWKSSGGTRKPGRGTQAARMSHLHHVAREPARTVDVHQLPNGYQLSPQVLQVLAKQQRTQLYSHQFKVLKRLLPPQATVGQVIRTPLNSDVAHSGSRPVMTTTSGFKGRDVIITTPTSSGKSLCFNLGVFEKIFRARRAGKQVTGLYLFPLNALAKDQEKKLLEFNQELPPTQRLKIVIITGEVKTEEKERLFQQRPPDILVTNPETLHYQLYRGRKGQSVWQHWRTFLARLAICVLDEAHTYSGIFGCNASNLIRRLYAAVDTFCGDSKQIQFILASATIGNPVDLASRLLHRPEDDIAWVKKSGANRPERAIITFEAHSQLKVVAAMIIESWIGLKWRSLVFCNTIDGVNKLRYYLQQKYGRISGKIRTYYASMPAHAKTQVMRDLEEGKVLCIICSNALEAGLDLPGLDACLMLGHPGSKMSFWQRIGRAGRTQPGVAVYLPYSVSPRDVYYASRPRVLLSEEVEKIAFNSDYPSILRKHMSCCAHESDFFWNDRFTRFGPLVEKTVRELLDTKQITLRSSQTRKGLLVHGIAQPWSVHRTVNLRGSVMEQVKVVWQDRGNVTLETLGKEQALWRAYPGAVFYSPDPRSGTVQKFDVLSLYLDPKNANSQANVTVSKRQYWCDTKPSVTGNVIIKESWGEKLFQLEFGILTIEFGWGEVHSELYGYEERKYQRGGNFIVNHNYDKTYTDSYEAPYLRFTLSEEAHVYLKTERAKHCLESLNLHDRQEQRELPAEVIALHTFLHQLTAVVPLLLLAPHDVREGAYHVGACEGFLVDSCSGGTGVCEMIYNNFMIFANKIPPISRSCTECRQRTQPADASMKSLRDRCIQVVVGNLLASQMNNEDDNEPAQDMPLTSEPSLNVLPTDLLESIDNYRQEFFEPSFTGCIACITHDHCPLQNQGLAQGLGLKLVPLSEL